MTRLNASIARNASMPTDIKKTPAIKKHTDIKKPPGGGFMRG